MGRVPSFILSLLLSALVFSQGGGAVFAQERPVERIGSAEAPVYEDNLDAAKTRAVLRAQHDAIRRALRDLVAEEWLVLFDQEVRRTILSRPQRYIGSYRVQKLQVSLDRTRYGATVAAQVNTARLADDLRTLSLPLKADPVKSLSLLYRQDDPALADDSLRNKLLASMAERLALLNFKVEGATALSPKQAELFENATSEPGPRGDFLAQRKATAGLYLAYQPAPEGGEGRPSLRAGFFQAGNGVALGNFVVSARMAAKAFTGSRNTFREAVLTGLVKPLLNRFQPGGVNIAGAEVGEAAPLKMRVIGFHSVEDQENFERAFFRREAGFQDFVLYRLLENSVSYRGRFSGDRRALEHQLPGKEFSTFRIRNVFWFNDVLELEVGRGQEAHHVEMQLFPADSLPPLVVQNYQIMQKEFKDATVGEPAYTEVEDNGWLNRANQVPVDQVMYGNIDSRGDADFFVAEELREKEELTISWYRLGRTNLNPSVRIYDENGKPLRQYTPRNYFEVKYKLPRGQHSVTIEVSDRYRGLKGDSGGYLSFHYLLLVQRQPQE